MKVVGIFLVILGYTMLYDAISRVKGKEYETNTMLRLLGFKDTAVHNDSLSHSGTGDTTGDSGTTSSLNDKSSVVAGSGNNYVTA